MTAGYTGSFPTRSVVQWLGLPQNDQGVILTPPLTSFPSWGSVLFSSFPMETRKSKNHQRGPDLTAQMLYADVPRSRGTLAHPCPRDEVACGTIPVSSCPTVHAASAPPGAVWVLRIWPGVCVAPLPVLAGCQPQQCHDSQVLERPCFRRKLCARLSKHE